LVKANRERDKKDKGDCCPSEWRDPQVSYAFSDRDGVIAFIKENIDKAMPVDEFSSTFDKAVKETK
jgi:hypothetical protein